MANRFRIIFESESIPHSLYIVHKRVPEAEREVLKKTILGWAKTKPTSLMKKIDMSSDFVIINDANYDVVRKMNK